MTFLNSPFHFIKSGTNHSTSCPSQSPCPPAWTTHPLKEDVSLGELAHGGECVLHNTHDRPVALWRDNHARHHGQLLDLGPCLQGLWQVQVHLIPIKVCIVRSCHTAAKERSQWRVDSGSEAGSGLATPAPAPGQGLT